MKRVQVLLGVRALAAIFPVLGSATASLASAYTIDWMNWSPWTVNNSGGPQIPSGQNFFLSGVGNVAVTFNQSPPVFSSYRFQPAGLLAGSVNATGDTYSWTNHEGLARTNFSGSGSSSNWSITFTFSNTVSAGHLALGIAGLGRIDQVVPGNITTASVAQNGTFLGDWGVSANLGPTQFTGGVGSFAMQNAIPGNLTPGHPGFNTALGVVRIDDAVTSLTIDFNQIGQDGISVNIGYIPAPGALVLLASGGLLFVRRRR